MADYQKKLQVFVSSTYEDLKAERQAAVQAILGAGHIPAGMELFTAGDEEQMEVIRGWIDECDIFMLIVGGRYGSIHEESKKSYTHLEWEYALSKKMRHFACVMTDEALRLKATTGKPDEVVEMKHPQEFEKFRAEVRGSRIVGHWSSETQLQLEVLKSLGKFARDESLPGWIRGDRAVSPEVANQIASLSSENSKLRADLQHASGIIERFESLNKREREGRKEDGKPRFQVERCQLFAMHTGGGGEKSSIIRVNVTLYVVPPPGGSLALAETSSSLIVRGLLDEDIVGSCEFTTPGARTRMIPITGPTEFSVRLAPDLAKPRVDGKREPEVILTLGEVGSECPHEVKIALCKSPETGDGFQWQMA